jgi:TolB-like protein/DNA-binding winged helix-turn-helix (wHTH) protein
VQPLAAKFENQQLTFGRFRLDLARSRFARGTQEIALRPKTYDLLVYLVRNARRVVSKEELMQAVWPGVVVTEDSLVRCIHEIREALGDERDMVRTVARKGYELDSEVSAQDEPARSPSRGSALRPAARRRTVVGAVAAALLASIAIAFAINPWRPSSAPAPPLSLVVLPFATLGARADQEYFAAAITDDLTTDLSRIPHSLVISRNTADTYRTKKVDAATIGRELSVRYLIEGSVQRRDDAVQVNVRLVDAAQGRLLWSNRFDGTQSDLGSLQQRVADGIVHTLHVEMIDADVARAQRERPRNPDARDLEMRAWALWNRQTPESVAASRELLEQALMIDPQSIDAWNRLSATYTSDIMNRWMRLRGKTREELLARFREAVAHVKALNPDPTRPMPSQCTELMFDRKLEQSMLCRQRMLELYPSDSTQHLMASNTQIFLGRPQEAIALARKAMRLSPHDSRLSGFHLNIGVSHFMMGDLRQALDEMRTAVNIKQDYALAHSYIAASSALLGDMETARNALADYRRLQPDYTIRTLQAERWSDHPVVLAARERYYEGLRKAGLPE